MATTRERVGRPTQFHGVPLEDRAIDLQGNRLPWALEWPDDHNNPRHHKHQAEEKGSFGKSTRRKGSSRATRTQTPARRENPTLDGFEAALLTDSSYEASSQPTTGSQLLLEPSHGAVANIKEPAPVLLYGYSPDTQWAAIEFYERVSGGMICEDYEREPPAERRRYQGSLGRGSATHARSLTKAEQTLAMQYQGGRCWIKVTFDSREAAERAIYSSPHRIQGHWVHAQAYHGQGRDVDEPILVTEDDLQQGKLWSPKPSHRASLSMNGSFPLASLREISSSNDPTPLPPYRLNGGQRSLNEQDDAEMNASSSTASSATVLDLEYPDLRQRKVIRGDDLASSAAAPSQPPATFKHFPDLPRTVLKPATEAFLPQPTWSERLFKSLTQKGLIPGDLIGNTVPLTAKGEFDWSAATLYWKMCYWLDSMIGTDLCGLREA